MFSLYSRQTSSHRLIQAGDVSAHHWPRFFPGVVSVGHAMCYAANMFRVSDAFSLECLKHA